MAKTRNHDKTPSVEPEAQSSQRTSRKRRASTASEASVQPASQQDSQQQTKRRKKTQKTRDVSASLDVDQHPRLESVEEIDVDHHDTEKHVHFSQASQDDVNEERSSATNITPHPRKHTIHRRITLSPADLRDGAGHASKTRSRASMPASLASQLSPAAGRTDIDFVPLKDLIQQRIQQRLHDKRNLFQLDGTDDNVEVQTNDDMMIYKSHMETVPSYPKLPTPSKFSNRTSQTENELVIVETNSQTASDSKMEFERAAFETPSSACPRKRPKPRLLTKF